jgi:hypothetical protein
MRVTMKGILRQAAYEQSARERKPPRRRNPIEDADAAAGRPLRRAYGQRGRQRRNQPVKDTETKIRPPAVGAIDVFWILRKQVLKRAEERNQSPERQEPPILPHEFVHDATLPGDVTGLLAQLLSRCDTDPCPRQTASQWAPQNGNPMVLRGRSQSSQSNSVTLRKIR